MFAERSHQRITVCVFLVEFFGEVVNTRNLCHQRIPLADRVKLFVITVFYQPLPESRRFRIIDTHVADDVVFRVPDVVFRTFGPNIIEEMAGRLDPADTTSTFAIRHS